MTTKQEKLFNYYYNLMSDEFKQEILNYEEFEMENVHCSVKVNFKNESWIRLYQKLNAQVEWY
jgi:hypothetical protein